MWTVGPLGWEWRHKHFQAPSVHNLSSLKIQKMVLLGQNCLLLKHGLQEISPQGKGTVLAKGFLVFVYSRLLLAFSVLLFPACLVGLFVIYTIVLRLYCNYLSSHVENSIPQLPCSPIFSPRPSHFSSFCAVTSSHPLFWLKCAMISKSTCSTSFQCCSIQKSGFCSKPF